MAYPVITDHFRATVRMQGPSGLPEDQRVNTWYFRNDQEVPNIPNLIDAIAAVLDAFYGATNGAAGGSIANLMSGLVTSAEYIVYDLGASGKRYPIGSPRAATWTPPATTQSLPGEVSSVLSYYAGQGPRKRGRLYLGPFIQTANSGGAALSEPSSDLQTRMVESALNVLNTTENVTWAQVSPTAGEATPVIGGWVDNAWDTQRSRGVAPTSRATWGAPASAA